MNKPISPSLLASLAGVVLACVVPVAAAQTMQGEVELKPATAIERDAGVWVDGQYLGHLRELKGKRRLVLVPGAHELLVKLAGYEDLNETIVVEPGQEREYRVSLRPDPNAQYPDEGQTAALRISVVPETAAVFVNDVYAGHVNRFNGRRGMRVRAGTHRIKIELPGYRPFETELTLLANQTYEIKTELANGSITEQSEALQVSRAAP